MTLNRHLQLILYWIRKFWIIWEKYIFFLLLNIPPLLIKIRICSIFFKYFFAVLRFSLSYKYIFCLFFENWMSISLNCTICQNHLCLQTKNLIQGCYLRYYLDREFEEKNNRPNLCLFSFLWYIVAKHNF